MSSDHTKNLAAKFNIKLESDLNPKHGIMIIEDQQDLRMIVAHQLQKMQFRNVFQKSNGYEAVDALTMDDAEKVDAYICSMNMPIMGGIDFLVELQENIHLQRAPFCITMDNVSKEKIMLAVESGVDEILVKPFTLGDIGPKLRAAYKKFHNPNNPEKLYELAKANIREKDYSVAEEIYRELAKTAKNAARPIVGLARIALLNNAPDDALKLLEMAENKNPHFVHTYVERAEILVHKQKYDDAIKSFMTAINLSPLNGLRYKDAADVLFKVKKYDDACRLLEKAIAKEVEFSDLFHFLSQAKFALKEYKDAAKYIKKALDYDEENVTYLNQLGICLKEMKSYDDAQKVYNKIIKLDPENVAALYNKAVLLNNKGENADAIKLLERLVKKHPDFEPAKKKLAEYSSSAKTDAA